MGNRNNLSSWHYGKKCEWLPQTKIPRLIPSLTIRIKEESKELTESDILKVIDINVHFKK